MKEYEAKKGWKFTYIIHPDGQYQILLNGKHLVYEDPDNYEESKDLENGKITEFDLFKIMVDSLLDDNMSDLFESLYFQDVDFEWLW